MKRLFGILAAVMVALILTIGLSDATPPVEAQGGSRQVEIKRVNMNSGQASTQTLVECPDRFGWDNNPLPRIDEASLPD